MGPWRRIKLEGEARLEGRQSCHWTRGDAAPTTTRVIKVNESELLRRKRGNDYNMGGDDFHWNN